MATHDNLDDEATDAFKKKGNTAKEKRKKSLPVRKLLELERSSLDPECKRIKLDENKEDDENTNSILGSLEKLVESSFTAKSGKRHMTASGILQRLGIDDDATQQDSPLSLVQSQTDSFRALIKEKFESSLAKSLMAIQRSGSSPADSILGGLIKSRDVTISPESSSSSPDRVASSVADQGSHPLEALREMCSNGKNKEKVEGSDDEDDSVTSVTPEEESKDDGVKHEVKVDDEKDKRVLRSRRRSLADDQVGGSTESKFFKYSELAKELSSR